MISSFMIGNFKAFSETQDLPIRPLTLIFGPNSSGKSSLIHALVLAHEAMFEGILDVHRTKIGGDSIDLGGFKQYVHRRNAENQVDLAFEFETKKLNGRMGEIFKAAKNITIGITIGEGLGESSIKAINLAGHLQLSEFLKGLKEEGEDLGFSRSELEKYKYQNLTLKEFLEAGEQPQTKTYRLLADKSVLIKMSARRKGVLHLDTVNSEHPIFRTLISAILETATTTEQITSHDFSTIDDGISQLVSTLRFENVTFLPRGIRTEQLTKQAKLSKGYESLMPISKNRRNEDLLAATNIFFPRIIDEIVSGLTGYIEKELGRFRYLGPLRSYPPRHIAFSQYHDPNWTAGGGFAWEEVRRRPDLKAKINEWLGDTQKLSTAYELIVKHLLTIDNLEKHYSKRISEIEEEFADIEKYQGDLFGDIEGVLGNLKRVEDDISEVKELVLRDKRTETVVSHRDVGIGISQVLPVLASSLGNKQCLIAIEQPEIHLHPALQAELGDVFIESALGENQNRFIIESHSEHLLLRIMRRIRETTTGKSPQGALSVHPEDVMVLFVEPDGSRSIVREMPLNENGELVKAWPGGFFEEGLLEIF